MSRPVFIGGTVAQHRLFVVALCRFQHHTLPLALVHYLTWSVVALALYALGFALFGHYAPIVLAVVLTAWAVRVDPFAGVLFGGLQAAYAWTTLTLFHAPAWMAPGVIVLALFTEVMSHHALQGYGPRPPQRDVATMPRAHKAAFVPYFVVVFGLFFLTLDLAMRHLGYRAQLNREASALAIGWHEDAMAIGPAPRELELHRRAIAELG